MDVQLKELEMLKEKNKKQEEEINKLKQQIVQQQIIIARQKFWRFL